MLLELPARRELRLAMRRLSRDAVAPRAAEIDRSNDFPRELWETIVSTGIIGIPLPASRGGGDGGYLDFCVAIEELARSSAAAALLPAINTLVATVLDQHAVPELAESVVPDLASGRRRAFWAFTEPGTGSDPTMLTSRAHRTANGWVLTAHKCFITQAVHADCGIIFANVAGRTSAFFVDVQRDGVAIGAHHDVLGLRGTLTAELSVENASLGRHALVGSEGGGFRILVQHEASARVRASAMCVGMAAQARDLAIAYGRERRLRGEPIVERFGSIRDIIAEIEVCVESARWPTYAAAEHLDAGHENITRLSSTARLIAARAARRAASLAMQVHGAYGYVNESAMARLYRDAKAYEVLQGSAEIQRAILSREILRGNE